MKSGIKKLDPSQIRYAPQEGEVIQNLDGDYLVYKSGEWCSLKSEGSGLNLGLYDLNKQIIAQLPPLEAFEQAMEGITTLYEKYKNEFFMLYGKEISYFTLFRIVNDNDYWFSADVIDCCKNVGIVKAMDLTESQDAIEIWVETSEGPTCLYLFPYDNGVVQVGETK